MYNKRSIFLSPFMIILYIMTIILLVVYFGFTAFFNTHYLPNTTVGTVSCGFRTAGYVETENTSQISRYSLLISDRKDTLYVLEGKDFDYSYVNQGEEAAILESQNPFAWPIALFSPSTYSLSYSVSYDEAKLQDCIDHLGLFNSDYIEQPVNAYIELNETGYTIVPEVMGNVPIAEQVSQEIFDAVQNSAASLTLSSACYVSPEIFSSSKEILSAASTIDTYLKAVITYEFWGTEKVEFGRDKIMSAVQLDSDFQVTLDTKVFEKFAQKLASSYNTYGDRREFKTSTGDIITIGGGDYGWVVDKAKEAAEIQNNILSGTPVTREPVWSQTARQGGPDDIGNTYIEVDYTNQHLYYYKEGELVVESDFVSGSMSEGWGSPDGIFDVNYKQRNATLRGETYESAVDYFVVFAYNVGFHDASWRKKTEFGGDTYIDDGSHGCINMPLDAVKKLYEEVAKGTPIVAYYRDPVILQSENCRISNAYSYVAPEEPEDTTQTP